MCFVPLRFLYPHPLLPHLGGPAAFIANIHQPPKVEHSSRTEAEPGPSQTLNDSSVLYGDWCFPRAVGKAGPAARAPASKLKPRRQLASSLQTEGTGATSWTRRRPAATCMVSIVTGEARCKGSPDSPTRSSTPESHTDTELGQSA